MSGPAHLARFATLVALCILTACGTGVRQEARGVPEGTGELTGQLAGKLVTDGRLAAPLQGAWRISGWGMLLEITGREVRRFHEATTFCYPDPDGAEPAKAPDLAALTYRGVFARGGARVDVFEVPGAPSDFTMVRIDSIPAKCRRAPAPTPGNTFQAMWEMMDLDYGFFSERHIDWHARLTEFAPKAAQAKDDDALQEVLIEALSGFNDDHVQLQRVRKGEATVVFNARSSPTVSLLREAFAHQSKYKDPKQFEKAWMREVRAQVQRRLTDSKGPLLNGALLWGKLPGNVGYIGFSRMVAFREGVTSLDDSTAAEDLALVGPRIDEAVAALSATRAMIVDVALNPGGRDLVSAEIADRFADRRRLAFTKSLRRPQGREPQERYIEPKGPAQYLKPVYLLTSERTVSAGETFTLMMRRLPQVTQMGQTTAGALSDILQKPLPGAFRVTIPNEADRDPDGKLYEGRGIAPQRALQVFDPAKPASLFSGHAAAISAILELIGP